MELSERIEVYKLAIKKWGLVSQLEMAQEEATEFALAIRREARKNTLDSYEDLIDECADMEIMIEQIKLIYSKGKFEDLVNQRKTFKVNRLLKRVTKSQM